MNQTKISYHIILEGNDIEAKTASKLKEGDQLVISRVGDELDTFELIISTLDGKELDMLSYENSFTIAPFLDEELVIIKQAIVDKVTITQGKSRATDTTRVDFTLTLDYNEQYLNEFITSHHHGFLPLYDCVQAMASYCLLDYEQSPITQTHLNRYELDIDIDDDSKTLFDFKFEPNQDYFFSCELLLSPEFDRCKVNGKIYTQDDEFILTLSPNEKQTMLNLVNHTLIFKDQDALDPVIEE